MSVEPTTDRPSRPEHEVEVTVIAPRSPEPKQFHFARTETVGQAARTAANAFGYGEGTPTFATAKRVILDRNETLAAAHVHNGETLHLVDVGGGV